MVVEPLLKGILRLSEVDLQEKELERGLKQAESRWSRELWELKQNLDENGQQGSSRGEYLLEDRL